MGDPQVFMENPLNMDVVLFKFLIHGFNLYVYIYIYITFRNLKIFLYSIHAYFHVYMWRKRPNRTIDSWASNPIRIPAWPKLVIINRGLISQLVINSRGLISQLRVAAWRALIRIQRRCDLHSIPFSHPIPSCFWEDRLDCIIEYASHTT